MQLLTGSTVSEIELPGGDDVSLSYQTPSGAPPALSEPYLAEVEFQDGTTREFEYEPIAVQNFGVDYPLGDGMLSRGRSYDGNPGGSGSAYFVASVFPGKSVFNLKQIRDEAGTVLSMLTYDDQGRTSSSKRAGDTYFYQFAYVNASTSSLTTVTTPLGGVDTFEFKRIGETLYLDPGHDRGLARRL